MSAFSTKIIYNFSHFFSSLVPGELFEHLAKTHGPRGGGKPKLPLFDLILARVFHEFARIGNFSASTEKITGVTISDSALSQRIQSVGPDFLQALLPQVLKPLAQQDQHPESFFHGYRLAAVDGIRFNLRNTSAMKERAVKNPCAKGSGEPAFAHLRSVVLVELGHHQPLGATFGWKQEGEQTLMRQLFAATVLPQNSLLLADQLYGSPSIIWSLLKLLAETESAVLMRAKKNLIAKRIKKLGDGSWLIEVNVRCHQTNRKIGVLKLRELNAEIHYEDGTEPLSIRLWTTLMDATKHPADKLADLYAKRWEEELFFRELKSHLHDRNNLLDAQTPETGVIEVIALLLAATLIARQREAVARQAGVGLLSVSFAKVYQSTQQLIDVYAKTKEFATEGYFENFGITELEYLTKHALINKRPGRSCPRTVRQRLKDWPKTLQATSKTIKKTVVIVNP